MMLALVAAILGRQVSALTVQGLFTGNMVLQQGKPIPVSGTATPGDSIRVQLGASRAFTVANSNGRWLATLPPQKAGTGYFMVIAGSNPADQKIVLDNVAIGEVWICSGQSNMELPVIAAKDGTKEDAEANYPDIRLYHVYHRTVDEPLADTEGMWHTCDPTYAKNFSAVAYYFGRNLYRQLHVPIGLIETDWGGTPAESWTPRQFLLADPALRPMVDAYQKSLPNIASEIRSYRENQMKFRKSASLADPGRLPISAGWQTPTFDDDKWDTTNVPNWWTDPLNLHFLGAGWYRRTLTLPDSWSGQSADLTLGMIDDSDTTYVNGVEVGATSGFDVNRDYKVPKGLLHAGDNEIAIRVWNSQGNGGWYGGGIDPSLTNTSGDSIPLSGQWKFAVENRIAPSSIQEPNMPLMPGNPWVPSSLWNGMVNCLKHFPIRGVIWYQGESNADRAYQYRDLFPTMIRGWRAEFNQGDFPFYFVQLPNFSIRQAEPGESDWAELREAQAMALSVPNTGMAVTIDIGSADTIHPLDKQDVGFRLSLLALSRTYHEGGIDSGPMFSHMAVAGDTVTLTFTGTGGGLYVHGPALTGFAIAGADRHFYWATAKVVGMTVQLSCPEVKTPVAVRYGWDYNPACNLFNGAGLPAAPFRTDDWTEITKPTQ